MTSTLSQDGISEGSCVEWFHLELSALKTRVLLLWPEHWVCSGVTNEEGGQREAKTPHNPRLRRSMGSWEALQRTLLRSSNERRQEVPQEQNPLYAARHGCE